MLLDGLVFRLEHYLNNDWDLGDECFRFLKIEALVAQYATFLSQLTTFEPGNVFELGIWDGGSVAFWTEVLIHASSSPSIWQIARTVSTSPATSCAAVSRTR